MYMKSLSTENVDYIKAKYPKGTKIELIHMSGEDDMPMGLRGTVTAVDDIGTIHVDWSNGRKLGLIIDEDSFEILD